MIKVADRGELMTAVEALPLFPLPGTVFIPHTMLPLHVFEARYRDLIGDVMEGNGYLAVPRLKPGWEQGYDGCPPVYTHAGFGKIVRYDPMPDGRANIVILGLGRVKIREELPQDKLYRVAHGELLGDEFPTSGRAGVEASVRRLRIMLAQGVRGRPQLVERVGPLLSAEMGEVPFVNGLSHLLLPDVDARQAYIELPRVDQRIEIVETLLAGALADAVAQA